MRPGDRLVCAFVVGLENGDQFKEWPLHVTIVPWFRTELGSDDLARELGNKFAEVKSFHVVMGDETKLGRDKTVNLVGCLAPFQELEEEVRRVLKAHKAWLVDESTKQRSEYQPHVTAQKSGRLYRGDTFICDAIHVVEQKGDHKEVVAAVRLGNEAEA